MTVQVAARAGAPVTVHVRDPGNAENLTARGAGRVLSGDQLEKAAFDAVLDGVGGASLERAIRSIRPGGTIVLFGATDRQPANLTLLDFIGHEGARILTHFSYASGDEASICADLAALVGLVARQRLRPTIGAVFDWYEADRALTALRSGGLAGKAVLTMGADGAA